MEQVRYRLGSYLISRLLKQCFPSVGSRFSTPNSMALTTAIQDSAFLPAPTYALPLDATTPLHPFQASLQASFRLLTPLPEDTPMTPSPPSPAPPSLTSPTTLFSSVWSRAFDAVMSDADAAEDRARLRSTAAPAAGAWLHSLPNHPRTTFSNAAFLTALRYRLGLYDPAWAGLRCLCGEDSPSANHVLRCGNGSPGPIATHHALREAVIHIAVVAGYQVSREPVGHLPLRPADVAGRRPDLALFDRATGTWRLLDVSICNPLQVSSLHLAATTTGVAASAREHSKRTHYADSPPEKPVVPLVAETFGCLGAMFHDFLADCAHRALKSAGIPADMDAGIPAYSRPYSQILQHFRQWVSCCLQRAQAHSLLTRAELAGLQDSHSPGSLEGPFLHAADADYLLARGPPPLE